MTALEEPPVTLKTPSRYLVDTVVMQPISLCNLDCSYCYLPYRHDNFRMSVEIAQAVASCIERLPDVGQPFSVLWHCGEPLAGGHAHLERLFKPFAALEREGRVHHSLQTNGTLVDQRWCDFFKAHKVEVGISVDGPAWANKERVDWRGVACFDRILRGVEELRRADIPFHVLAVVGQDSLDQAKALYPFFASLGCESLGVNIEDPVIGNEIARPVIDEPARAERFWSELAAEFLADRTLRIREFDIFCACWDSESEKDLRYRSRHDATLRARLYPTVGYGGKVTFLSPEFLDSPAGSYGSFVVGNVMDEPLERIIARSKRVHYMQDYVAGQDRCKESCDYYGVCYGGYAQHKFLTFGTADATVTPYCKMSRIKLFDALAAVMRTSANGRSAQATLLPDILTPAPIVSKRTSSRARAALQDA